MMVKLKISAAALQAAAASPSQPPPPSSSAPPKPKKAKSSKPPKAPKQPSTPAAQTPPVLPKIKFRTSSISATPMPAATPKPVRPTLKLTSSSFTNSGGGGGGGTPVSAHALPTPTIKLKTKAKPPLIRKRRHEPGNGYDSEASDREDDPAIEEQFILRMPPGADCDYLRGVIERKELATTADVWMKFKDQRRAVVNVRGHLYAAVLVDLPCIVESNKTLDKKNIFKAADICQMLLVKGRISHEQQVMEIPTAPQDVTFQHGITPPMQYVRKRRFRKRISNRTIEAVEAEVDRLLREDEEAEESKFTVMDAAELEKAEGADGEHYDLLGGQQDEDGEYDEEEDAEGEMDYEFPAATAEEEEEVDEDMLANDLENALMGGDDEESDEDEDEDQAANEEAEEMDEAAQEKLQERVKLQEEIQDLRDAIAGKERELNGIGNAMLRNRVVKVVAGFKAELELKVGMLNQLG